jgi:CRISPR/Cas system-associated endonuclease Cas1
MRRRPLHVVGHDAVVGVCGGRLEVRRDGAVVASAPLLGVSEVVLTGYVTVTTPALHRLLRDDVPVVLLAGDGRARGRLEPPASSHAECRRRQLAISGNEPWRLAISRRIVSAKLANQARMGLTRFAAGLASLLEPGDRLRVQRPCPACWAAIEPRPATADPLGWLRPQILTPPGSA